MHFAVHVLKLDAIMHKPKGQSCPKWSANERRGVAHKADTKLMVATRMIDHIYSLLGSPSCFPSQCYNSSKRLAIDTKVLLQVWSD